MTTPLAIGRRLSNSNHAGQWRARTLGLPRDDWITGRILKKILILQNFQCNICATSLLDEFQLDHIIAFSKGGGHTLTNLQFLCPPCNRKKDPNPKKKLQ